MHLIKYVSERGLSKTRTTLGVRIMGFKAQQAYETNGEALFDLLSDEAYLEAKWSAMDHHNITITTENDGTTFTIKSERNVPANVPSFAAAFLSDRNDISQTDVWTWLGDGNAEGTWEVTVKGVPIKLSGTMTITQTDDTACTNVVQGAAKVSIPLVGGKIAAFVHEDTLKTLEEDFAFTVEYINSNM